MTSYIVIKRELPNRQDHEIVDCFPVFGKMLAKIILCGQPFLLML